MNIVLIVTLSAFAIFGSSPAYAAKALEQSAPALEIPIKRERGSTEAPEVPMISVPRNIYAAEERTLYLITDKLGNGHVMQEHRRNGERIIVTEIVEGRPRLSQINRETLDGTYSETVILGKPLIETVRFPVSIFDLTQGQRTIGEIQYKNHQGSTVGPATQVFTEHYGKINGHTTIVHETLVGANYTRRTVIYQDGERLPVTIEIRVYQGSNDNLVRHLTFTKVILNK